MLAIIFFIIIPLVSFFYFKWKKHYIFLVFVGLLVFYYTPFSFYLEPSYWQFRNMCKLNELPNDEYKYNKILSYFDTDLDRLDWDKLNEKTWKIKETNGRYKQGIFEYQTATGWKYKNSRIEMEIDFLSNKPKINRYSTNAMLFTIVWYTRRYFLERKYMTDLPHEVEWIERILGCSNDDNMTPKGENNE